MSVRGKATVELVVLTLMTVVFLLVFPNPFLIISFTGVAYALVHLPDPWTTLVTIGGGIVWSFMYYRYHRLLPLALSHAALGSTFYYWVCGHDLVAEVKAIFQ